SRPPARTVRCPASGIPSPPSSATRGTGVRTARSTPRRRARPAPENPDDREEGPALMPRARLARMSAGPSRTRMDDVTVERVLRVVDPIPPGQGAAYGEIGAIGGVGPRLVGRVLRTWGGGGRWRRGTNACGGHPLPARARRRWEAEA